MRNRSPSLAGCGCGFGCSGCACACIVGSCLFVGWLTVPSLAGRIWGLEVLLWLGVIRTDVRVDGRVFTDKKPCAIWASYIIWAIWAETAASVQ